MIWQARKDEDLTYMFAYINGFLEDVTVDNAVIDVNGFGINVRISADTASRLPGIGEQVRLFIIWISLKERSGDVQALYYGQWYRT